MNDDNLEENLKILKDYLKQGKIKFAKHLSVISSLEKVKYLPNGKIDLSTVDSSVRALANGVAMMEYRKQLKTVSLRDIQKKYFEMLGAFFENPYQQMIKNNLTPHEIARDMAETPTLVKATTEEAPETKKMITEFWQNCSPIIEVHLQEMKGLKTMYGGDIFPSYKSNILSKTGLYVETTVLPDPMLRTVSFFEYMKPKEAVYYFCKHALAAYSLKDVILAEVDPPIAIIANDYVPIDLEKTDFLQSLSNQDMLTHLGTAFGKEFTSEEELDEFLKKLNTVDSLEKSLKEPEKILFDIDWKDLDFKKRWEKAMKLDGNIFQSNTIPSLPVGQRVKFNAIGRMFQSNELLFKSTHLSSIPIIDAPTSWQYFLWKYEYDQKAAKKTNPDLKNLMLVNALQNDKLTWLGNVPYDALIKLRMEGYLNDLRELFSKDIGQINTADEKTYQETVSQLIGNINQEFYKHMSAIKKNTTGTKKFLGFDIAPWLVTGGISITAASTGNIPLSILSAGAGLVGISSAKDIWKKGKELIKEKSALKRSPVGILFDARQKGK